MNLWVKVKYIQSRNNPDTGGIRYPSIYNQVLACGILLFLYVKVIEESCPLLYSYRSTPGEIVIIIC
jgi:hypothetical protein